MNNLKYYHTNKLKNKLNIALIGHMGAGKSLIGKLIAKKLNLEHIDSDNLIEKQTKMNISQIFHDEGEKKFRLIEEKTIINLKNISGIVLSLGGGSILSGKVRKLLKKKFLTLFLDTNIDILLQRLKNNSKRPLLNNTNIKNKIKEIDAIRRKYYLKADIKINNNSNPSDILDKFLKEYNKFYEKNY